MIMTLLSLVKPLVTRQQFLATYDRACVAEQADDFLSRHGIWQEGNLCYRSSALVPLSLFGLYGYLAGSMQKYCHASPSGKFRITLTRHPLHCSGVSSYLHESLGVSFHRRGDSFDVRGGVPYARLLSLLGFYFSSGGTSHKQTKASQGSSFPPYLTTLIDVYPHLPHRTQNNVRPLLTDFVQVLFHTRAHSHTELHTDLSLPAQPTADLARHQATLTITLLNGLYPLLALSPLDHRVIVPYERTQHTHYRPFVRIPTASVAQLGSQHTFPLRVQPHLVSRTHLHFTFTNNFHEYNAGRQSRHLKQ